MDHYSRAMKTIIFGTTNPGKIAHVQTALDPLGIKVEGLTAFGELPDVEEDGETPEENARKKATAYCQAISQPVMSMDNALYLDGVSDEDQPGMHVRRIPGLDHRPDDEEMVAYYRSLIEKYGGKLTGHWRFGF